MFLLLLCSCEQEKDFLAYQNKSPKIECTVNEKFKLVIEKSEKTTIYVNEPSELKSVKFELSEGESFAITDDLKIPISSASLGGIFALGNMLSLKESEITSVKDEGKDSIVIFESSFGTYTVTYGKNALPKSIEIRSESYDYDVLITGINLK